jgi:hypothetical protein
LVTILACKLYIFLTKQKSTTVLASADRPNLTVNISTTIAPPLTRVRNVKRDQRDSRANNATLESQEFESVKDKAVSQLTYRNDENCDAETIALEIAWPNDCYRGQGVYFALLGA